MRECSQVEGERSKNIKEGGSRLEGEKGREKGRLCLWNPGRPRDMILTGQAENVAVSELSWEGTGGGAFRCGSNEF